MTTRETQQAKDPQVAALRDALQNRDPFYTGICSFPEEQRHIYYTDPSGIHRRIDFSNADTDDLEALYRACQSEESSRNGENVLDESCRKARKMDLISFATLIDPRSLGIHEQIFKALLTESHARMELELSELNVYGKGDFSKAHKDRPRDKNMIGSLVVTLPTLHEGGQLVLRQSKEWTIDFADEFAKATEPSVCFVAFYGDIEHEVLPVTSGYHVTLTYNLYHKPPHPTTSSIPTPCHVSLRQALADVVNDKSKLPNGGYLGFGLFHDYVHTRKICLDVLQDQLKGTDRALVDACDALGVPYCLRLFYPEAGADDIHVLATEELDVSDDLDPETTLKHYLVDALDGLTQEQAEGVVFVGEDKPRSLWNKPSLKDDEDSEDDEDFGDDEDLDSDLNRDLRMFYKDPVTEVLNITWMLSSVGTKNPVLICTDEGDVDYIDGGVCMMVAVEPAELRRPLTL